MKKINILKATYGLSVWVIMAMMMVLPLYLYSYFQVSTVLDDVQFKNTGSSLTNDFKQITFTDDIALTDAASIRDYFERVVCRQSDPDEVMECVESNYHYKALQENCSTCRYQYADGIHLIADDKRVLMMERTESVDGLWATWQTLDPNTLAKEGDAIYLFCRTENDYLEAISVNQYHAEFVHLNLNINERLGLDAFGYAFASLSHVLNGGSINFADNITGRKVIEITRKAASLDEVKVLYHDMYAMTGQYALFSDITEALNVKMQQIKNGLLFILGLLVFLVITAFVSKRKLIAIKKGEAK